MFSIPFVTPVCIFFCRPLPSLSLSLCSSPLLSSPSLSHFSTTTTTPLKQTRKQKSESNSRLPNSKSKIQPLTSSSLLSKSIPFSSSTLPPIPSDRRDSLINKLEQWKKTEEEKRKKKGKDKRESKQMRQEEDENEEEEDNDDDDSSSFFSLSRSNSDSSPVVPAAPVAPLPSFPLLQKPAPSPTTPALFTSRTLTPATATPLIGALNLSRGSANKAARMARDLLTRHEGKANHLLGYYVKKSTTWEQLIPLVFQHMHKMNTHNYIRVLQRLVDTSSTRVLLDPLIYQQFGRFMVQAETRLHEFHEAGLMHLAFLPYHYLRQCLIQMRLAQENALQLQSADPEKSKKLKAEAKILAENEAVNNRNVDEVNKKLSQQQKDNDQKYKYDKNEAKSKKIRMSERRAGRLFESVGKTLKQSAKRPRTKK